MKASKLILTLQKMIDEFGDREVEAYDNTIAPVRIKRVVYTNAQDCHCNSSEKVFRIRRN